MNYNFMPSLEQRALVKIATILWNQDDIRALIVKIRFPLNSIEIIEARRRIEYKVIEKVKQLPQPEFLKKKVFGFINPIGLQIFRWLEYHHNNYFGIDLPHNLCWTPQGTVDKKKTAEALIRDENLDITIRYKLACIYCLESDIPALWNKIPKDRRESFYAEEDPRGVDQHELVVLWTYDIKGEVAKMDNMIYKRRFRKCSPYQYAFEYAAVGVNKVATEYFLQKLTHGEREESLIRYTGKVVNRSYSISKPGNFPKEDYADVLCFLLSQMNEEQQAKVFKSYPYKVLVCFLDWPWQDFFMETANRMWAFLPKEDYDHLLGIMAYDYQNQKLFGEFWQRSPVTHKEYVIDKCASGLLLLKLFMVKDKENISLILKDSTLAEKEKIFSYHGNYICRCLYFDNEWDLLKFFLNEIISSQEEMMKFIEEFKKHIISHFIKEVLQIASSSEEALQIASSEESLQIAKDMIESFQMLDDLIQKDDKKRGMEEGNSSPAKKFHSLSSEHL